MVDTNIKFSNSLVNSKAWNAAFKFFKWNGKSTFPQREMWIKVCIQQKAVKQRLQWSSDRQCSKAVKKMSDGRKYMVTLTEKLNMNVMRKKIYILTLAVLMCFYRVWKKLHDFKIQFYPGQLMHRGVLKLEKKCSPQLLFLTQSL